MNLTEKSAYIKGLAEGLELDKATKEGKILAALLELVDDLAAEVAGIKQDIDEIDEDLDYLNDYIEELDDDLQVVEDFLDEEVEETEDDTVIGAAVAEDSEDVEETAATETASEGKMNADSVDAIVRTRIQLGMVGRKLNLDGLEMMRIMDAKKAIIHAVRPNLRLDGKSVAYINAAYDMAVSDVNAKSEKDTGYQKRQMFNGDGKRNDAKDENSASAARERMIARRNNNQ